MHVPNRFSKLFVGSILICTALGVFASSVQAQSLASCTFTFFPLLVALPSGTVNFSPAGINDFGTVVGSANISGSTVGAIRWNGGGFTFVQGTTSLVDRNDSGISIGYSGALPGTNPVLVRGTSVRPITLNNLGSIPFGVGGINNWGSIAGTYSNSTHVYGLKRWSNGNAFTLFYPGARTLSTWPARINDGGTVVGSYYVGPPGVQLPENGFIYNSGNWATLNYPNPTTFTHLVGISNSGVIVGNGEIDGGFLYQNGVFKVISAPNNSPTNVLGISPRLELILGTTTFSFTSSGFIAKCH